MRLPKQIHFFISHNPKEYYMRGSLKVQIGAALKCCTRIGTSRHDAKLQHGGRSPYIHAMVLWIR